MTGFDSDTVDRLAQADLDNEIQLATEANDVEEEHKRWEREANVPSLQDEIEASTDDPAKETGTYQARECGNCHNILWLAPVEAINQVFDGEGWIECNCGAVAIGKLHTGHWTP